MICPESANFFYGEYGVSRESMSNPGKPGFSFCFSIQVPLLSYAFSVFSVSSVSVREEKFLHTQLHAILQFSEIPDFLSFASCNLEKDVYNISKL